jgi:DNA modification methylase
MALEPDPRNSLNELSNRQWLIETKSFWLSRAQQCPSPLAECLADFVQWLTETRPPDEVEAVLGQLDDSFVFSRTPPRSALKALHPATFSEADVERLIHLFTRPGERVLDPFLGSGSALVACAHAGRHGVGIELSDHWAQVASQRLAGETTSRLPLDGPSPDLSVLTGDAREVLPSLEPDSFDFLVTSPPYWSILTKAAGLKAKAERTSRGLATQYSDSAADLGNMASYEEFLQELAGVFAACQRVLRPGRYMAVVVSDFRHGPRFHLFHADLAAAIEAVGPVLKGLTVLAQDNKNLYPFAIPFAFVSNIHHQYILLFQKPREKPIRRSRVPASPSRQDP